MHTDQGYACMLGSNADKNGVRRSKVFNIPHIRKGRLWFQALVESSKISLMVCIRGGNGDTSWCCALNRLTPAPHAHGVALISG